MGDFITLRKLVEIQRLQPKEKMLIAILWTLFEITFEKMEIYEGEVC